EQYPLVYQFRPMARASTPARATRRPTPCWLRWRRTSRTSGRDDADLLQEAERVPHFPRLRDLAAAQLVDGDRIDGELLAGRRDAVHLTNVGARPRPAHDDLVAGGEEL